MYFICRVQQDVQPQMYSVLDVHHTKTPVRRMMTVKDQVILLFVLSQKESINCMYLTPSYLLTYG